MTTSLIRRLTKFFGFKVINYDFPRWHTAEWENWDAVDALLNASGVINVKGVWANSTAYIVGNRLIDADLGTIWQCAANHTSAASGTFGAARAANPSYWTAFSTLPNNRGAWATGVAYTPGDIVVESTYKYYYCIATHTASASFATDASKWALIFDATVTINACAAIYDAFDDRYLGAKAIAPTADNDGNPLATGALYFNTATNDSWYWNGSTWVTSISYVADNSVTNAKMADNAIGTAELIDGLLSANAPGRAKMADKFVTLGKIEDIISGTMLGRLSAGAGSPELILPSQHRIWAVNPTRTVNSASSTDDRTLIPGDVGRTVLLTGTTNFTLTTAAGASLGNGWSVYLKCTGNCIVTLDPNGSEQINGLATITMAKGQECQLVWDGSGFQTIGLERTVTLYDETASSAVSSIPFELPLGYRRFEVFSTLLASLDGNILAQLSNDGGATYQTSGYSGGGVFGTSSPSSAGFAGPTNGMIAGYGIAANPTYAFGVFDTSNVAFGNCLQSHTGYYTGGTHVKYEMVGTYNAALLNVNYMRLVQSAGGTLNSGTRITVRGLR